MTYEDHQIAIRLQALVRAWREYLEEIGTCQPETMAAIETTHEALQSVIHSNEPWGLKKEKTI